MVLANAAGSIDGDAAGLIDMLGEAFGGGDAGPFDGAPAVGMISLDGGAALGLLVAGWQPASAGIIAQIVPIAPMS